MRHNLNVFLESDNNNNDWKVKIDYFIDATK